MRKPISIGTIVTNLGVRMNDWQSPERQLKWLSIPIDPRDFRLFGTANAMYQRKSGMLLFAAVFWMFASFDLVKALLPSSCAPAAAGWPASTRQ
jgi:hypothetical protein